VSFYLAQAGSALQAISTDGSTIVTLTLPAGVTIDATKRGWFTVLNHSVQFFYAPSINLLILPASLTVIPLSILAPTSGPTLAVGAGTGLTGTYRAAVSYIIKDADGNTINESPRTDISPAITLANNSLEYDNLPIPTDPSVTGRRLYRTAAGGTDLFQVVDIDDVVTTTFDDSTSDDDLELLPADPTIEAPPGAAPGTAIQIAVVHKERIFAVGAGRNERDEVIWSEVGKPYAFASDNGLNAPPVGVDTFGVTGFLSRRDSLGCIKRRSFNRLIGDTNEDFGMLNDRNEIGCYAPHSCVVIDNQGYFLGIDGVYRWNDDGVVCITEDTVDGWFTSDTFFNRTEFPNAIGGWNNVVNAYVLGLCSPGSTAIDRWVKFMIDANNGRGEWLGPDETDAFDSTIRARLTDANGVVRSAIGAADGFVYLENANQPKDTEGDLGSGPEDFPIDSVVFPRFHFENDPSQEHVWGRLFLAYRQEDAGVLEVTPYVGDVKVEGDQVTPDGSIAQTVIDVDLTLDHTFTRRFRVGRVATMKFQTAAAETGQFYQWLIYGYNLPVFSAGTRK
jgi:hypothetical protein